MSEQKQGGLLVLLILGALTTVSPFSIDMYLPAFQRIATTFSTTVPKVSLSLSSYFVGLALGQIFYGPFLDRIGRKRPLYFGLVIYILASIACIFSPTVDALIFFRFIQALGGCAAGVASMTMVRDFFPPKESAKVFSKLMLILSVSPLFAPTVGSFISSTWGWKAVFASLALIGFFILLTTFFFLPDGRTPDPTVSLKPNAILQNFASIFKHPRFFAYALAGGFSFAGLFAYLAGSPAIFWGTFHLSEKEFGLVFALLSVGVVGGGQLNLFLLRRFSTEGIFRSALYCQLITAVIFLIGSEMGWYGLTAHILIFFVYLSCAGLTYPNAVAIALEPFEKNSGSASALLGFLQMALGALSAAAFGLLKFQSSVSVALLFGLTAASGFLIFKFFNLEDLQVDLPA